MPEHLIHLRKAWLEHMSGSEPRRRDLPLASAPTHPLRLSRSFGRPPITIPTESLWLRLRNVPGLHSVRLNDQPLALDPVETHCFEIPLPPEIPVRNRIELEIAGVGQPSRSEWGRISLVVRS